jgi:hypothetical protein
MLKSIKAAPDIVRGDLDADITSQKGLNETGKNTTEQSPPFPANNVKEIKGLRRGQSDR